MAPSTKFEDKMEGIENFLEWKYMIGLIIKESGLEKYIKDEVAKPTKVESKDKHEQDLIKAMRIITDSIKDHLIPQVSSKKTPNQMYDALHNVWGKEHQQKDDLRAQLKGTKMSKGESIQAYFTRVSQFRE